VEFRLDDGSRRPYSVAIWRSTLSKTWCVRLGAVATAVLGLVVLGGCSASELPPTAPSSMVSPSPVVVEAIVGAWSVEVQGAPYGPHLFAFVAGGVMLSTNPTDVQAAGKDGTNDSVGFGTWQVRPNGPGGTFEGTFWELNASSVTHKPSDALLVTWVITVSGDRLVGTAQAALSSAPTQLRKATFSGTRIGVDQAALASVA
jgi:hypothetical protein